MISGDCLRLQVNFHMSSKRPKARPRNPRADAQRNRTRILEIAKDAFTSSGANISLDEVARQAHIGAGTLYRHFPMRDSLLESVYRTEVEKLAPGCLGCLEALPKRASRRRDRSRRG